MLSPPELLNAYHSLQGFDCGVPSLDQWLIRRALVNQASGAVLLFGGKRLPELARGLGQALGEFKKARNEFERENSQCHDRSRS